MKKSDTAIIRSVFSSDPTLQSIATSREGNVLIVNEPLDSFLVGISKPHTEFYDERVAFDVIKVDVELAMVWAHLINFMLEKGSIIVEPTRSSLFV
jgi:hypothetical protein